MQHVDDVGTEVLQRAVTRCRRVKAEGCKVLAHLVVRRQLQLVVRGRASAVGTRQRPRQLSPADPRIERDKKLLLLGDLEVDVLFPVRREEVLES
eukprot:2646815-Amphidinium_carterae.1